MKELLFFDPQLDLRLEREVPVPVAWLWKGWTDPELLKKWFCPLPWRVEECEIDLRPGGRFRTRMLGPDPGQEFDTTGTFLEVIDHRRLVWTGALGPNFRPQAGERQGFDFTAYIEFEPTGEGSLYRATALHGDAQAMQEHNSMGFEQGWGIALDQLVNLYH